MASNPAQTSLACIEWTSDGAIIRNVTSPAGDDVIAAVMGQADKTGIDCPLGWPESFVDFVTAHRSAHVTISGAGWPGRRSELTMRRTDIVVHERLKLKPLSVSADRIAYVAMRCAILLARLAAAGHPVDRSGAGRVVEVYPAASLKVWQLTHRRYKGSGHAERRSGLVGDLLAAVPWLDCGQYEQVLRDSADAFDAVVAALTARAAFLGKTDRPAEEDLAAARTEGWIAVPNVPAGELSRHGAIAPAGARVR
jgi:hypothetical protein